MKTLLLLLLPVLAQSAVTCSITSAGFTSIQYNSRQFLTLPWGNTAAGYFQNTTFYNNGSATAATSDNSTFFQFVYDPNGNGVDKVTIRHTPICSGNTLTDTILVTNNDNAGHALTDITLPEMSLTVGADTIDTVTPAIGAIQAQSQAFVHGTFGSLTLWTDFSTDSGANVSTNSWTTGSSLVNFSSQYQTGVSDFPGLLTTYGNSIADGASFTYTISLRFGSTSDTFLTLSPEANAAMQAAIPNLNRLADRRRIANLFVTNSNVWQAANNPRGYLDVALNALNQTAFNTALDAYVTNTLAYLATWVPKPQGVLLWDWDGQEFPQAFTYVGHMSKLAVMAPEMDARIDFEVARFVAAGYKIGITIRPQTFLTGSSLPGTCFHSALANNDYSDIFVNSTSSSSTYPQAQRIASCTATNTWTYIPSENYGNQTAQQSLAATQAVVETEVNAAISRWGSAFAYAYVDSTVYEGGQPYDQNLWRNLAAEYPTVTFFPEEWRIGTYSGSGAFETGALGTYRTDPNTIAQVSQAFGFAFSNDHLSSGTLAAYTAGQATGDILSLVGWFPDGQLTFANTAIAAASLTHSSLTISDTNSGKNVSVDSLPAKAGAYPYYQDIYFAATRNGLAASTTHCLQQSTVSCYQSGTLQSGASLNLSGLGFAQIRYYDFTGALRWSGAASTVVIP